MTLPEWVAKLKVIYPQFVDRHIQVLIELTWEAAIKGKEKKNEPR